MDIINSNKFNLKMINKIYSQMCFKTSCHSKNCFLIISFITSKSITFLVGKWLDLVISLIEPSSTILAELPLHDPTRKKVYHLQVPWWVRTKSTRYILVQLEPCISYLPIVPIATMTSFLFQTPNNNHTVSHIASVSAV